MPKMVRTPVLLAVTILLGACSIRGADRGAESPRSRVTRASPRSLAYAWVDVALEATARDVDRHGARPTVLSRTLAIPLTAMYDAWAAYDARAVGTRLGATLRRPVAERNDRNREQAISCAAYRALIYVYPEERTFLDAQLRRFGYDPGDAQKSVENACRVGNTAAGAVIEYRTHDGANQLGDEPGGNGEPYGDTTGYRPVNPPERIIDPDRWQPIAFSDGKGGEVTPGFLTPQWSRVRPFGLERGDQFRPPPPPKVASAQLRKETEEVMAYNANLDCEKQALVEFMRDGPRSTGQSGHWIVFAQAVSRRDGYTLEQDVKLFFAVANVALDAFIASWDAKRAYDSSRPWTLAHHYFRGKQVRGWAGPGKGVIEMPGEQWRPFSPPTFVTPPFPGYVSGHSTVSGACSAILARITGSDRFGQVEVRRCGVLTEPRPGDEVTLSLPTFTATAELAGLSRIYGGYHIQADNVAGLKLGRSVAAYDWQKITAYFDGTARTPRP